MQTKNLSCCMSWTISLKYLHSCDVWPCGAALSALQCISSSLPRATTREKLRWSAMQMIPICDTISPPPSVPVKWLSSAGSTPRPSPDRPCTPSWRPPWPPSWRPPRPSGPSWPSCLTPPYTPSSARSRGRALAMQSIPTSHGWKYSRVALSTK